MSKSVVVAQRNVISTLADVGNRAKGERFLCPSWLAQQLEEVGDVKIVEGPTRPKADRASTAGPTASTRSSSQVAQASRKRK